MDTTPAHARGIAADAHTIATDAASTFGFTASAVGAASARSLATCACAVAITAASARGVAARAYAVTSATASAGGLTADEDDGTARTRSAAREQLVSRRLPADGFEPRARTCGRRDIAGRSGTCADA